jgi:hypothetical protein
MSIALLWLVWLALWSGLGLAQGTPDEARARASLAWQRAGEADEALRFDEAVQAYRQAFLAEPSAPFAPAARNRALWLEQRAKGGFVPLATLERLRRDPQAERDASRVAAFYETAQDFPPGQVRVESMLLVADLSLRLLDNPAQARQAWQRVLHDPAAGQADRAMALGGLVDQALSRGELSEAAQWARTFGDAAPGLRAKVLRLQRRALVTRTAAALLLSVAASSLAAAARSLRRRGLPALRALVPWWAWFFGLYLGAGGAALAYAHSKAEVMPFLVLGGGTTLLIGAARAWREAFPGWHGRAAALVLGALGAAALALLALQTSSALAEGFGL